jgi:hypothetical protein
MHPVPREGTEPSVLRGHPHRPHGSQGETGTGKAPNPRDGAFLKSNPNRKRSLVLGFIAGPVVNQPFVHPRYVAPGNLCVLKSGDGICNAFACFQWRAARPPYSRRWAGAHAPAYSCPASLNQALNPFNAAHRGHGTLGPHALGGERDRDH